MKRGVVGFMFVLARLNGKVDRSQRTDLEEFYPTVSQQLLDWQDHYKQYRPHGAS